MTDVIVHAATWVARLCYPASGRHRTGLTLSRQATGSPVAPGSAGPESRAALRHAEPPPGEMAAMVRPYFLAHEKATRRRGSRTLLVCARPVVLRIQEVHQ